MLFKKDSVPPSPHEAPLIELVSQLLRNAYEKRASDIHLEPLKSSLRIRFRIDGVLNEIQRLPKKLERPIMGRLKMMTGSMDLAERRLPQDGRFQFFLNNHINSRLFAELAAGDAAPGAFSPQQKSVQVTLDSESTNVGLQCPLAVEFHKGSIDVRVATVPTIHGESMVLRLLDPCSQLLSLSQLGLEEGDLEILSELLQQPDGLILITGPTGSGKTTTLYACMKELQQRACKIITVEDPIEYRLAGITQVQVKEKIGLTFPAILRSTLRQAPNKIVVGEIRDEETANIAITASLTGHLILSTLHANDAASTMARLQEIKISPFMIASGVRAIIAQRLVRRLCSYCKEATTWSEYEKKALGLEHLSFDHLPMKAIGCSHCHGKGFRGRLGIFEILILTEEMRGYLQDQQPFPLLFSRRKTQRRRSLREDGILKVKNGLTTAQEVISNLLIENL